MGVIRVSELEDSFVIHFQSDRERINAYTLASTLVAIADAAKAANGAINPGYDIEVVVEGIGPGSFRAKIRAIYASAKNLFSRENVKAIILGVVASYIYQHTFSTDTPVSIEIKTDEVTQVYVRCKLDEITSKSDPRRGDLRSKSQAPSSPSSLSLRVEDKKVSHHNAQELPKR